MRMYSRVLPYVTVIVAALLHLNAATEYPHGEDSGTAVVSSRARRSTLSRSYRPRAIRTLSNYEIDAFNAGLHRKRPKFIGKRDVWPTNGASSSCVPGPHGGCVVDERRPGGAGDKRGPPRKFLGKKSDVVGDIASNEPAIDRALRSRKFVGKRGQRKFLGRRSGSVEGDVHENEFVDGYGQPVHDEVISALDKRARRKFLG